MSAPKNKKYAPEHVARARELCAGGATLDDLAREFSVSRWTLNSWRKSYPDFADAVQSARRIPNKPPVNKSSIYKPELCAEARKLCEAGALDAELAEAFGVSEASIHRWRRTHPEFAEATKIGKAGPDERVKNSLYRQATGYFVEDEKPAMTKDGKPVRIKYKRWVEPNVAAAIFWSKNRMPEQFRDVKAVEYSGVIRQVHVVEEMSDERIREELKRIDAALAEKGAAASAGTPQPGKEDPRAIH